MTTFSEPDLKLLSVADVAVLLHCSDEHVYRLIRAGELPTLDIATPGSKLSKTRIRETDLAGYLERAAQT